MALAPDRSWNGNLTEGMTDNSVKKLNPDRGGFIEDTTQNHRRDLYPLLYSYTETPERSCPDGSERLRRGQDVYSSQMFSQR